MAERKKYKSPMSGMWRGSMPRPVRQGPLPLDQAYSAVTNLPGSARNLGSALGVSGLARPMSGLADAPVLPRSPEMFPLDQALVDVRKIPGMIAAIPGSARQMGGAGGLSGAARGVTARDVGSAALNAAGALAQLPMTALTEVGTLPGAAVRGAFQRLAGSPSVAAAPVAVPPPTPQRPPIPDSLVGVFSGPQNLAQSRLPRPQAVPGQRPPTASMQPPAAPQAAPMTAGAVQPAAGESMYTPAPPAVQVSGAEQLANQLQADRMARRGLFGGPSPQAIAEREAAIQSRLANPEPGSLGDFMRGEMGARSEEGREARRQQMDQSFLSKPMQGGGFSMADREARLSMLSPPGQRQAAAQEQMASRARTGTAADEAIRAELMRQGVTQEQLNEAAELRGDPDIALGGRRAISMLAPGTSIRTPEGGLIMRGRDRQTTPEDLERRAAGRIADRLAPQERMNRMRAGRQAMMANRAAAEREMFERATNPLVNPMLLAGNPVAMAEAMRIRQQQQEFLAGEPERQARIGRTKAETEAFERANSQEMLDLERQQRELAIKKAEQELAAGERLLDPAVAAKQESDDAFNDYLNLTPEERRGPLGRELINRWRAGTSGASPLVPPQTAADARDEATALSQPITALIGEDPNSYRTADSLLKKIRSLQESGVTISEQDQTAVQQYIQNRSMYDATFGSNLPTPLQGLGDWIMSAASLPFSASVQQSPQATPPQFMYPRMGG